MDSFVGKGKEGDSKVLKQKIMNAMLKDMLSFKKFAIAYMVMHYHSIWFHYDKNFNPDSEVLFGLYETIERMVLDRRTRFLIDQQLEKFKAARGHFGMSMAIDTRDKKQLALWWESYGGEDIESDDEWITEKEDPCLPIDSSWMDIHECFGFNEGAPSKKRKRGNLIADLENNDKTKSKKLKCQGCRKEGKIYNGT
ncbi:hypothetical protein SESBI_36089 [Sesbania bispinosa]|nr:hypothetical protein SESBI_36089 [Sesbania bispinosa]